MLELALRGTERLAAARGKSLDNRLLDRVERFFGPAAVRKIPTHDLPRAAVDHADQVRPAHRWPGPHSGHVRLLDLI